MSDLRSKWTALPRALKWAFVAVVVVVGYFGVAEPLLRISDRFSTSAENYQSALNRERDFATPDSGDGQFILASQRVFGKPHMPGTTNIKPESFYRLVDGVLQGHGVSDSRIEESKVRLSGDAALALGVGDIDRLILNITFDADPGTVMAILSDLERAPDVASVSRVRIDKVSSGRQGESDQLVRATLAPEAWIASQFTPTASSEPEPVSADPAAEEAE